MDSSHLTRSESSGALTHRRVAGKCYKCGTDSRDGSKIVRAITLDAEGTYYPMLCESCFDEMQGQDEQAPSDRREYLQALLKVMPEEYEDIIVAEMSRVP